MIFAFPLSVSMTAPLVRMFRLTKCRFAVLAVTILMVAFWYFLVFASKRLTTSDESKWIFLPPPFMRRSSFSTFAMDGNEGWFPRSYNFFPRCSFLRPPEGVLSLIAR